MKHIKLYDGVTVIVDNDVQTFKSIVEMYDFLRITQEVFPDADMLAEVRRDITAKLLAFGNIDLSAAYAGHTVIVKLIPAK